MLEPVGHLGHAGEHTWKSFAFSFFFLSLDPILLSFEAELASEHPDSPNRAKISQERHRYEDITYLGLGENLFNEVVRKTKLGKSGEFTGRQETALLRLGAEPGGSVHVLTRVGNWSYAGLYPKVVMLVVNKPPKNPTTTTTHSCATVRNEQSTAHFTNTALREWQIRTRYA